MSAPSLRSRLIGAWQLESYIAHPDPSSPSSRPIHPMTKSVTGIIMYTPDGYMSAQMCIPGQPPFQRDEADDAQWAEAGRRYFAYSGPFYVTDEKGLDGEVKEVLRHHMQVSNLPGWRGQVQMRGWRFEDDGDLLVLGTGESTMIKGELRRPELKWRKMSNNVGNLPPSSTSGL